jgi:hypothetical protein
MAKTPSFMKGKYTKSKDEKMDARLTKKAGLDKEDKEKFEKMDKAHGKKKKPKTIAEDKKIDTALIKKIKAKAKAHEKKEGKKGEEAEEKREKKKEKK